LGAILTKVFSKQLASTISDIGYSIKMLGPNAKEKEEKKKTDLLDQLATEFSKDED
jgi:hypothetical protein